MTKDRIKPSGDRKTRFYSTQKNTFGMLPGRDGTCPMSTTGTGGCWAIPDGRKKHTCYVDGLMGVYKGVYGVLAHNTHILTTASGEDQVEILNAEFGRFRDVEQRRSKRRGTPQNLVYRLHWAGDIFSEEYAESIAKAVKLNPDMHFWNYTRSFFAIPTLAGIDNLTQYISLDDVNAEHGLAVYEEHKHAGNIHVCYMSREDEFERHLLRHDTRVQVEEILKLTLHGHDIPVNWLAQAPSVNMTPCPVDTGKLDLEGGCAKCQKCFAATTPAKPVWFKA